MTTDAAPDLDPVTDARADAAPVASAYSGAAVINQISGLGGTSDSGQAARPNLRRLLLSDPELEALYRDTVYGRLCEMMPDYATQRGWAVSDGTPLVDPLADRMEALGVADAIARADALARGYGYAALWLVTDDDAATIADPLDLSTIRTIHALHALSFRECNPVAWDTDVKSRRMGKPARYSVCPNNVGRSYTVHASRLIILTGDPTIPSQAGDWREGAPLAWRWWDALRDLMSTSAAAARAAQELSVGVFRLANLAAQSTGDQASSFATRMALLNMGKSVANSMVITAGEEYKRESIPATGFQGLSDSARTMLSLVTGYPEQLLYGTAPGGLSSDGDSWWRSWTNTVAAYQTRRYLAPLRRIVRALYAERGGEPEKWSIDFLPLGALDDKARAEIRSLTVQSDATEIASGVLAPDEVRERYATGRYEIELQPRAPASAEPSADLTPEVIAAARARIEALRRGDADTYSPPEGARGNARQALRWREEHGGQVKAMTAKGWSRARQLASGEDLSVQDVIEMRAWFARHGAQSATRTVDPKYKDEPWRDAGYVSWLGWGGDTARAWLATLNPRSDAADKLCLLSPLDPAGQAIHAAALAAVQAIVPDLEVETEPHITLLYLGEQANPVAAVNTYDRSRAILSQAKPATLQGGAVTVFDPRPGQPYPIVIEYRSAALATIAAAMTRANAPHIVAEQPDRFRAHATLGYIDRLTPEQIDALEAIVCPGRHVVAAASLRLGRTEIGRPMPLGA